MTDFLSFRLSDDFIEPYKDKPIPWGFDIGETGNSFGELVFIEKYSRLKADGSKERWYEVCRRVVEGTFSILKDHVTANRTHWNANKAQRSAEQMFDRMFHFKWSPPGRGLWMMGTEFVNGERDSGPLYNCSVLDFAAASKRDPGYLFGRLLEMCMYGIGVGYTTQLDKDFVVYKPEGEPIVHVVGDSREGWAEALRLVLNSYLMPGKQPVELDYSAVRPAGSLLKRFGGVASGPEPFAESINIIKSILEARIGDTLKSTDVVDINNLVAKAAVSGGSRRSALLSTGAIDDNEWLSMKNWELGHRRTGEDGWAWMSNNSVIADVRSDLSPIFTDDLVNLNGEPGVLFLDMARNYGRLTDGKDYKDPDVVATNPCLAGDTLVAVADGRGAVPIEDLAAAGKDVPVYTINSHGGVSVRTMRNPRVTGTDQAIYRVSFDDGSHVDVTGNHKFILLNGEEKEALDLAADDALFSMTRKLQTYSEAGVPSNSNSAPYYWLQTSNMSGWRLEHRVQADYYVGKLPKGHVVHHADFDSTNNSPDNLVPMPKAAHIRLHADKMRGEGNPMHRGFVAGEFGPEWVSNYRKKMSAAVTGSSNPNAMAVSNEDLLRSLVEATANLGRRLSTGEYAEWAKNAGVPTQLSFWRADFFGGGLSELLTLAAYEAGVEHVGLDPRTVRYGLNLESQGYSIVWPTNRGEKVKVQHTCKACGTGFSSVHREVSYCSTTCVNHERDYGLVRAGMKAAYGNRRSSSREAQLDVFIDLKSDLGREPLRKEWKDACKDRGVSAEISRKSSPFTSWQALKDAASVRNHRVVSVEYLRHDTVYNGTVDEFHTMLITGPGQDKDTMSFVLTPQCGEIFLNHSEVCNLTETYPINHETKEDFLETLKYAYLYAKAVTLLPTPWAETNEVIGRNRRIGTSMTGVADFVDQHGWVELRDWLTEGYDVVAGWDRNYSSWLGVRESIRTTTVKPAGTTSTLVGLSPGVHWAVAAGKFFRRQRLPVHSPLVAIYKSAGYHVEPARDDPKTTVVVTFPVIGKATRSEQEVSVWEKVALASDMQRYWADNAVSVTLTFNKETEAAQLPALIQAYQGKLKGASFLPYTDGETTYLQQPFEKVPDEVWDDYANSLLPIPVDMLYEAVGDASGSLYCDSDSCEIPVAS